MLLSGFSRISSFSLCTGSQQYWKNPRPSLLQHRLLRGCSQKTPGVCVWSEGHSSREEALLSCLNEKGRLLAVQPCKQFPFSFVQAILMNLVSKRRIFILFLTLCRRGTWLCLFCKTSHFSRLSFYKIFLLSSHLQEKSLSLDSFLKPNCLYILVISRALFKAWASRGCFYHNESPLLALFPFYCFARERQEKNGTEI